jgi:hypothetical protein
MKGVFNYGESVRLTPIKNPVDPKTGKIITINKAFKKVKLLKYGKGLNYSYVIG